MLVAELANNSDIGGNIGHTLAISHVIEHKQGNNVKQ